MRFSLPSFRAALAATLALLLVGAGLATAPAAFAAPGQTVTIGFASATGSVAETSWAVTNLVIQTSDGDPLEAPVSFNLTHTGGTASHPGDFNLNGGNTTLDPATTPVNTPMGFTVASIVSDSVVEPNETFQVTLSNVSGATVTQASSTLTITNNDVATVTVADVSQAEGNAGTSTMTFTVQVDSAVQNGF